MEYGGSVSGWIRWLSKPVLDQLFYLSVNECLTDSAFIQCFFVDNKAIKTENISLFYSIQWPNQLLFQSEFNYGLNFFSEPQYVTVQYPRSSNVLMK